MSDTARRDPGGPDGRRTELAEAILEHSTDGVFVLDASGCIAVANGGFERMLGAPKGTLDGADGLALVHPDDRADAVAALARMGTGNARPPQPVTYRLRHADGAWVTAELLAAPGRLEDGRAVVTVRDVSQWVQAEQALKRSRRRKEVVSAIAARFVEAENDELDGAVDASLAELGTATDADRCYVFRMSDDLRVMENTHEWCAPDVEPQIERLRGLPWSSTPSFCETLARGDAVHIASLEALPTAWAPEREILAPQGIRALLAVPMTRAGRLTGFLGFDSVHAERSWSDDEVDLLRVAADVIGSALARGDAHVEAAEQEQRFRALVQSSNDLIVVLDREGRLAIPPLGQNILGYEQTEMAGKSALDLVHPEDLPRALEALAAGTSAPGAKVTMELRLVHQSGAVVPVELAASNLLDDPRVSGLVLNVRKIEDRIRAERELRDSEERFRTLVMSIPGAVFRCEARPPYRDIFISDAIEALTGYSAEEFVSQSMLFEELILPGHRTRTDRELEDAVRGRRPYVIEYPIRHRDGDERWLAEQGRISFDVEGQPRFLEGVIVDISARKALEARLAHDAAHDPLTGLPNRVRLLEHLNQRLQEASRRPHTVAVLFLDLDRFKLVNDALGHQAGDELLVAFARRLAGVLRGSDLATRTGGDEFVIVCSDIRSAIEAEHVAARILRVLAAPFELHGREVFVTASLGIAIADGTSNATGLLRDADAAAYRAKERGRNRYEVFDAALRAATAAALATETELHRALEQDQLVLHYQPLIELGSGRVVGFEGLVRWEHPERGLLGPPAFLDAAEASGLIVRIGRHVVNVACRTLASLPDPALGLAVNLSPRELAQPDLVDRVADALRDWGIAPERLCLEITEGALLEDAGASLETLHALKDTGVRLAIDDFGTGYSSLSYLRRMPVDIVKIDRSFLAEIGRAGSDDTIVAAVASLARGLGLDVVAEGVERPEQARLVHELGCTHGQGFAWSPALPLAEAVALATGMPVQPREHVPTARH